MNIKSIHDISVSKIAEKYRQEGYTVIIEPKSEDIPFDLGNYRPDLIAKKNDTEGFLIEFKYAARQTSIERFREIADIVAQHTGWRFLLVTEEDSLLKDNAKEEKLLSWEQILRRRSQSERLISLGETEGAFLLLWATIEALLRQRAEQVNIPIQRLPLLSLINQMYSQGEISIEEYDRAMLLLNVRNRFVHGFQTPEINDSVSLLLMLVNELMSLWEPELSHS